MMLQMNKLAVQVPRLRPDEYTAVAIYAATNLQCKMKAFNLPGS
uniref:Uncharacterized protein n=1 Tax=Setaria italica TaxID=4555 RepID=K3YEZ7_SETIT